MINLLPTIRLAQLILKHKFRSVGKPLRIQAPPKISPSKRAFEKYKPQAFFSEFYGILKKVIDCLSPEVHSLCEFFPLDTEKKKKC